MADVWLCHEAPDDALMMQEDKPDSYLSVCTSCVTSCGFVCKNQYWFFSWSGTNKPNYRCKHTLTLVGQQLRSFLWIVDQKIIKNITSLIVFLGFCTTVLMRELEMWQDGGGVGKERGCHAARGQGPKTPLPSVCGARSARWTMGPRYRILNRPSISTLS